MDLFNLKDSANKKFFILDDLFYRKFSSINSTKVFNGEITRGFLSFVNSRF